MTKISTDGAAPMLSEQDSAGIETLHEFPPINEWEGTNYKAKTIPRIIRFRNTVFLDIREFQTTAEFSGFTKRGLRLKVRDAQRMLDMLPTGIRELKNQISKHFAADTGVSAVAHE